MTPDHWFPQARYGLFIHYGLYSLLGRGEWVMNKEEIPPRDYQKLARQFTAEALDFDALLGRAKERWGMRYSVLTTKHHDGFCLYDSSVTQFSAPNSAAQRDLVAEFVAACRKHDLRVGLYHSLNDWSMRPNAVDALEDPQGAYQQFIDNVHAQIADLMSKYGKIDTMWYDGWWPFNAEGWQAEELMATVRELQPEIIFNGRSGLPGDFDTPEQHVRASRRPWEACLTLNGNWGYHRGDHDWKSPKEIAGVLRQAAAGQGNVLLNLGPRGDGSIPEPSVEILDTVGDWLRDNESSIRATIRFEMNLRERADARGDWTPHGAYTANDDTIFLHVDNWPGSEIVICGLECQVSAARFLADGARIDHVQEDGKLRLTGLPETMDTSMPVVIAMDVDRKPRIYKSGGWRNPEVDHCRYDPLPSDLPD